MLKTSEFKKAGRAISVALKGLDQVTFHLEVSAQQCEDKYPLVRTKVTLWFGQTFQVEVQGDEDIACLAHECRERAEKYLAKMHEIVKATKKNGKLTK